MYLYREKSSEQIFAPICSDLPVVAGAPSGLARPSFLRSASIFEADFCGLTGTVRVYRIGTHFEFLDQTASRQGEQFGLHRLRCSVPQSDPEFRLNAVENFFWR
jgi:hypothetical protein